jgi:hemerythrin-like domain-containing protein
MCDYCGCQDVPVIAELTAEHDRLRELGRALASAARADDRAAVRHHAWTMRQVLGPHTAVEEGALFPALAAEYPDKMAALTEEHRSIDRTLDALSHEPLPADWRERVSAAVHNLFEHILKEQDGVFPAALATLGPPEWDALAVVRERVGSGIEGALP